MEKIIVPVNVEMTRFYRMYVKVNNGATEEQVKARAKEIILNSDPDEVLVPDNEVDIEGWDILALDPDFDAAWIDE